MGALGGSVDAGFSNSIDIALVGRLSDCLMQDFTNRSYRAPLQGAFIKHDTLFLPRGRPDWAQEDECAIWKPIVQSISKRPGGALS